MTSADGPVQYMPRTLHYYRALGYDRDYVWATHDHVPFAPLPKPLAQSRVALITTASPPDFDGVKRVWSGRVSSPPPTLFTDNVAWDKESTHTNDRASFLPIEAVSTLASEGLVAFREISRLSFFRPSDPDPDARLTVAAWADAARVTNRRSSPWTRRIRFARSYRLTESSG